MAAAAVIREEAASIEERSCQAEEEASVATAEAAEANQVMTGEAVEAMSEEGATAEWAAEAAAAVVTKENYVSLVQSDNIFYRPVFISFCNQ